MGAIRVVLLSLPKAAPKPKSTALATGENAIAIEERVKILSLFIDSSWFNDERSATRICRALVFFIRFYAYLHR
jgi:hypothetical protein